MTFRTSYDNLSYFATSQSLDILQQQTISSSELDLTNVIKVILAIATITQVNDNKIFFIFYFLI